MSRAEMLGAVLQAQCRLMYDPKVVASIVGMVTDTAPPFHGDGQHS